MEIYGKIPPDLLPDYPSQRRVDVSIGQGVSYEGKVLAAEHNWSNHFCGLFSSIICIDRFRRDALLLPAALEMALYHRVTRHDGEDHSGYKLACYAERVANDALNEIRESYPDMAGDLESTIHDSFIKAHVDAHPNEATQHEEFLRHVEEFAAPGSKLDEDDDARHVVMSDLKAIDKAWDKYREKRPFLHSASEYRDSYNLERSNSGRPSEQKDTAISDEDFFTMKKEYIISCARSYQMDMRKEDSVIPGQRSPANSPTSSQGDSPVQAARNTKSQVEETSSEVNSERLSHEVATYEESSTKRGTCGSWGSLPESGDRKSQGF